MSYANYKIIEMKRAPIQLDVYGNARFIGFSGSMFSGKSTAATFLRGDIQSRNGNLGGARIVPFAEPLKNMLLALGLAPDDVYGSGKDKPHPLLCGKTPRHAMQKLGTEWRDMIGRDLWINIWRKKALKLNENAPLTIIADDVRFEHEIKTVRDMGGIVIKLERYDVANTSSHASEKKIPDMFFDAVVQNDSGYHEMYKNVNAAIADVIAYHGAVIDA